ncbi:hypothetical protein FA15DRAFT_705395 [Coprinopsis marcescibilis]|uniref:Uncharacterized protein n=1 Tax=Coprinopsis marcescibilis TaxID=230819 RepID=A0A5C3KTI8_COPMA|nr:hypothetical protein FA15DRAFT_705395 [Coprinopsis marcescibilis]
MSSVAAMIETLRRVAHHRQVFNYVMASSLVLYAIDYLHTLPTEKLAFDLWTVHGLHMNKSVVYDRCALNNVASSIIQITAMIIAEAIMFVRVYALCGKNRMILYWLILQFITNRLHPDIIACVPIKSDTKKLAMVFAIILVSESMIMLISLAGFWKYRKSSNQLFKTLRNDGIIYYISLTLITAANIIFDTVAPVSSMQFMLAVPQAVLHSVLSCRLVLQLYEASEHEAMAVSGPVVNSGVRFAPRKTTVEWTFNFNRYK